MFGIFMKQRGLGRVALLVLLMLVALAKASAQAQGAAGAQPPAKPTPTPEAKQQRTPEREFFINIMRDQRAIWTSPLRLRGDDAKWIVPLGISTAALMASDQETGQLSNNQRRINISRDISLAGSVYSNGSIVAGLYVIGRATGNPRARETGLLGAEALIDSTVVFSVLKNISQRPRPTHDDAHAEFFDGGHSFPSGHAANAWALATVIASEYRHRRAVQIGAYGLAAAVSASRYTGRNHFLSDVLVGGALGYGIGKYVYRKHHDRTLDEDGVDQKSGAMRSKLMPMFAPSYSRAGRAYGLALAWDF